MKVSIPDKLVEKDLKLVDLQAPKAIPEGLFSFVKSPIERAFRLDMLNEVYRGVRRRVRQKHFFDATLDELRVQYAVSEADLARIPREGPLLVVANHPFGGLEGIILGSLLNSVRKDVKVLGQLFAAYYSGNQASPHFPESFWREKRFPGQYRSPEGSHKTTAIGRRSDHVSSRGSLLSAAGTAQDNGSRMDTPYRLIGETCPGRCSARILRRPQQLILPGHGNGSPAVADRTAGSRTIPEKGEYRSGSNR